jgi:hypothetical protein
MIETMRRGAAADAQPDARLTPVNLPPDDEMASRPSVTPKADANAVDSNDVQVAQAAPSVLIDKFGSF